MGTTKTYTSADVGQPSRAGFFAALPQLKANEVAVRNRAYACPPSILSNNKILFWRSSGTYDVTGELVCAMGSHEVRVAADNLATVEPRLHGIEADLPNAVCAALVAQALSPLIELLQTLAGIPLQSRAFERRQGSRNVTNETALGFVITDSQQRPLQRGWIRGSVEALQMLEFQRALPLPAQRYLAVPLAFTIQVGYSHMTVAELAGLCLGDALRIRRGAIADNEKLPVRLIDAGGTALIAAVVINDELHLEKPMSSTVQASSSVGVAEVSAPTEEIFLSEIECNVSFELGTLRMTVADVARLRTGQTIRLGVRLRDEPVKIVVNGRPIAKGELAGLGDELVVVVTDTSRLPHV